MGAEKNRINSYLETCVVALKGSNRGSSRQVSRMHRICTGIPGWRSVIAEARTVCLIPMIPVVFDKLIAAFVFVFLNQGLGILCKKVGCLRGGGVIEMSWVEWRSPVFTPLWMDGETRGFQSFRFQYELGTKKFPIAHIILG